MSIILEHDLSILPVTALLSLEHAGNVFVVSGAGNRLQCYVLGDHTPLSTARVLQGQAIHGIVLLSTYVHEVGCEHDMLVFGGRQLAWVALGLGIKSANPEANITLVNRIMVSDWVLCAKPSSVSNLSAVLLTSYNVLFGVSLNHATHQMTAISLCSELSTFLYSADISSLNDRMFIVASGTAFGEVLTWLCKYDALQRKWQALPWREYRGHKGSVFGVSISHPIVGPSGSAHRLLASCSDDRTINIWDLSNVDESVLPSHLVLQSEGPKSMLFTSTDRSLSMTWAHLSRIWNVDFVASSKPQISNPVLLLSTAEDGQSQSWSLDARKLFSVNEASNASVTNMHIDRHHVGKNIWSRHSLTNAECTQLFTGGADGRIVRRSYKPDGSLDAQTVRVCQQFKTIVPTMETGTAHEGSLRQTHVVLKSYLISANRKIIATSDTGLLLQRACSEDHNEWSVLLHGGGNTPLVLSSNLAPGGVFVQDPSSGDFFHIDVSKPTVRQVWRTRPHSVSWVSVTWASVKRVSNDWQACVAIKYFGRQELDLLWIGSGEKECDKTTILLPETFDLSSATYSQPSCTFMCGSRTGAIAVYCNVSPSTKESAASLCRRRVHGQDTVTSINVIEVSSTQETRTSYYLTTGRDGTYCVLRLEDTRESAEVSALQLKVLHQATPPFGPNLERAELVTQSDGNRQLLLYGFRSKDFVAWNETSRTQVMTVDCGGAHRSWDFRLNGPNADGGSFVWTKARTFMLHNQGKSSHSIVQAGGHGREIKASAAKILGNGKWLIATGSEDTDIRLFEYYTEISGRSSLRNIAVIRRHTTGLQDLCFLDDEKTLISAAGMEEMYAWSLSPVPVIGQGVVFSSALPRTDAQSDARIMSIAAHTETITSTSSSFIIVAALSNGQARIVRYETGLNAEGLEESRFEVLRQLNVGIICLTQVHVLNARQHEIELIIGATNGFITTYFGAMTERPPSPLDESKEDQLDVATPASVSHCIHQNSITAMQRIPLAGKDDLLITGGDDNSFAITIITHSSITSKPTFRTLSIPKAHAAAITALTTITIPAENTASPQFLVVTASNDQRLNIWSVKLGHTLPRATRGLGDDQQTEVEDFAIYGHTMDRIQIELLAEEYTNVADISGIATLELRSDELGKLIAQVIVVGVGMEVLNLELPC